MIVLSTMMAGGTYAAFSSSTSNAGNTFVAGTVTLSDNDAEVAMFSLANARPGAPETGCLQVSYTGSVATTALKLYGTVTGPLAGYVQLTVVRGTDPTPSFDACTTFTGDTTNYRGLGAGVLYSGTLAGYPADFTAGIADPLAVWTAGQKASYRFTVEILDNNAAQGLSSTASFGWEARG
jgi:predicted ribosomally synthesized peptide with SipW-like signal peptide